MNGPPDRRPNVVVFLTDQQRWDSVGVHGNPLGLTPNFDRLAAEATHLTHAFTCQPVCAPARSALQTGLYPTQNGVYRNNVALDPSLRTLAHHFRDGRYTTGYIGKWHLAATRERPVPKELRGGYEYWLAGDAVEFISDAYDARLFDNNGDLVKLPGYRADAYVDAAIQFVAAPRQQPFLLFVSLLEPHHQNARDDYPAPAGYRAHYESQWTPADLAALGGSSQQHLAGYWGMIRRIDEAFGRLIDALESLGMRDDTIVAFASDHGCHFRTRNDEYKRSPHDASIRIPALLDGPGFRGRGNVTDLVSLIDLPPTLLDAAGLPVPQQMQGRSLLPLLGGSREWPTEVFVQISESEVGRAVRTRRWKYAVTAADADGYHDASSTTYTETALYDLRADPHELTNLAGLPSHRHVAAALRQRLVGRMVEAGENEPEIVSSPERPPADQRAVDPAEANE